MASTYKSNFKVSQCVNKFKKNLTGRVQRLGNPLAQIKECFILERRRINFFLSGKKMTFLRDRLN